MPITSRGLAALLLLTSALAGCEQPRFDPTSDARAEFEHALSRATAAKRYLMVVFGADWCTDCRKLYENLHTPDVRAYMSEHMDFMTVDVGRRERNLDLAAQLGVSIGNGIPVAVFFDPTGNPVGTTNDGQLEPSRYLTSRQILGFVQAVVTERRITRPAPADPQPEKRT